MWLRCPLGAGQWQVAKISAYMFFYRGFVTFVTLRERLSRLRNNRRGGNRGFGAIPVTVPFAIWAGSGSR